MVLTLVPFGQNWRQWPN